MGDAVRLTVTASELEAEIICGLLRTAGIPCGHRKTDMAAAWQADPGAGPREVLVAEESLEDARQLLSERRDTP